MTLAQDLAAAQSKLATDTAAAAVAHSVSDTAAHAVDLALQAAATALDAYTALNILIAADEAEVARIQALIDAGTSTGILAGGWCQTGGYKGFQSYEAKLGAKILGFRSSGGEGQLDNPFVIDQSLQALAAGHVLSLQIQPKTGSGSNRTGVSYKDIAAGKHDTTLIAGMNEFKVLPANAKVPLELHSEFTVQSSGAQPPVGPAADYAGFVMHLDKLLRQVGVRDRVTTICGAAGATWDHDAWKPWITPALMASGAVDVLGTDFYSRSAHPLDPDFRTKGLRAVARSFKVPWAVMETGCEELPNNGKAAWFDAWGKLLQAEGHDCFCVFLNLDLQPYRVDSSTTSLAAWKRLMGLPLWRTK